jgi:phosphoadenosine phosphosulfate reductase
MVATDFTEDELRELAERGAAALEGAGAVDVLRWVDEHFGGVDGPHGWANCKYVVAANMQDAVMVSLASDVRPGVPVLFLDTGYHFAEAVAARGAVESVDEGYPSIGCAPCTAKPAEGEDPRSGRWHGRNKIECGLHAT